MSNERKRASNSKTGSVSRRVEPRERANRIVEAAVELATAGGFEGVRTRDICAAAGVSMSALYRIFDSKEEILLRAFAEDLLSLEAHLARRPIEGSSPEARVQKFFELSTGAFLARPSYARAVIAAMGSGQHRSLSQLEAVVPRMTRLIDDAITGRGTDPATHVRRDPTDRERAAIILHRVWFSLLVGWAASVYSTEQVFRELAVTADYVLKDGRHVSASESDRSARGV